MKKFEDTKGPIRSQQLKERQYNDQKKNDQKTNKYLKRYYTKSLRPNNTNLTKTGG